MTLAEATIGARLKVEHIGGSRAFRRRLMELGLVPGTELRVVRKAPFGGPITFLARTCTLTIQRKEAEAVLARGVQLPAAQADAEELSPSLTPGQ